MANRYANLVPPCKIKDDFQNITIGFDLVQEDVDALNTDTGDLQQAVQTAQQTADTAVTNAGNAQTAADNAQQSADDAQAAADGAQTTADTAVTKAENAQTAADGAQQSADDVASDLADHKADDNRHLTTADRTKFAGIEDGAQVNQNAFAMIKVEGGADIVASVADAFVKLVGDIGITITSDPVNGVIKFTVTGESAPAAHASTHLPGGADPIQLATISQDGLMSKAQAQALADAITAISGLEITAEDLQAAIDGVNTALTTHTADTTAHGATSDATPDSIAMRDANGQLKVGAPTDAAHVARKQDLPTVPTFATQAQAEAGTDNATIMTPQRTNQAIQALVQQPDVIWRINTSNNLPEWSNDNGGTWNQVGDRILSMTPNRFNISANPNIPANGSVELFSYAGKGVLGDFDLFIERYNTFQFELIIDGEPLKYYTSNDRTPKIIGSDIIANDNWSTISQSRSLFSFNNSFSIMAVNKATNAATTRYTVGGVYYT